MHFSGYVNPYYHTDIIQFFFVLLSRIGALITGKEVHWASDELQMLVLILIALSSALVGSFLMLRKMTMLANSLSHTILLGIVGAYWMNAWLCSDATEIEFSSLPGQWLLLPATFVTAIVTTFLSHFLHKHLHLQEDASVGIVFTTLFSLGIILVTVFSHNAHIGIEMVMGNVDALSVYDLKIAAWALLINLVVVVSTYRGLLITTFDSIFAYTVGLSNSLFSYLIMILTSITIIGAFKAVGMLMVLSFLIGVPLIARQWTNRWEPMILLGCCCGIILSILGVAVARHLLTVYGLALSTSGVIVCLILISYLLSLLFSPERGFVFHWFKEKHLKKKALKER